VSVASSFTKRSIQEFAETSLAAPATLVTDGLGCFMAVRGTGILPNSTPPAAVPPAPGIRHFSRSTRLWAT
jgi:hypothetical protein